MAINVYDLIKDLLQYCGRKTLKLIVKCKLNLMKSILLKLFWF